MRYTLAALASASLVLGHGYVENATINGQSYPFYDPNTDPYTSPTPERISRKIPGNGPVENVTSIDIQCNGDSVDGVIGSAPAALHAPAAAGDNVTLFWSLWPDSHYGALVTYMARCPDTGCQDWLPNSTSVWFKIAEDGLITPESAGGQADIWAVDSLEVAGNAGYTYTIPSCLADGFYLVRHEIIAVFLAGSYPGAQLYPGCHQLNITGGAGSTVVDSDELVAFPGAYAGTDPGITWDSSSTTYPIPGPSVFSCAAGSGSGDAASSESSAVATQTLVAASSADSQTSTATTPATAVSPTQAQTTISASSIASSQISSTSSTAVVPSATSLTSDATPVAAETSAAASTGKKCSKRRGLQRSNL
ncbi:glycosyl hydrolase family 61-domain-containing protein [Coniella lustricola]|uniref:lytic cellulose monooxygenase (C4-dehydrogenating) n=1 Tax=Coniella lustricola TaxID=2025994 RepID=A0A2T3AHQ1_9PEZI|nr:glycosyl hydrolase family 61-domain-containing protein [Coniella lustricola]